MAGSQADTGRWLVRASFLVTLALGLMGAVVVWDARSDAAREADEAAANIAAVVAQDALRNVDTLDRSLQRLRNGLQIPGISDRFSVLAQAVLFDATAQAPYIGFVQALDENGVAAADSTTTQLSARAWSDRDYFVAARHASDSDVHISKPVSAGTLKAPAIIISRRRSHADGSFAGVVLGTLQLAYFRELFSKLDIGPHGIITLLHTDGTILMRLPFDRSDIGRVVRSGSPFRTFMQTGGTPIRGVTSLDGLTRRFTYRKIDPYPLVVAVGLADRDIFAVWWLKTYEILGLVAGLCLVNIVLGARLGRQLQQSLADEAKYRQLTENVSDIITRVDGQGGCNYASPATRRMLGVAPQSLTGHRFVDAVHPADQAGFEFWFAHLREDDAKSKQRFRMRRPDGTEVWIETVAGRLTDGSGGFVLLSRDVTSEHLLRIEKAEHERELEQRNAALKETADKLTAANQAQARFVATMSHEIRTPLANMLDCADALSAAASLGPDQREQLDGLRATGRHLCDTLNLVLERARPQTGAPIRLARVDLSQLLDQVLHMFEPAARARNLSLRCECDPGVPREIVTDRAHLQQTLVNLLDNAVKYTPRGGVCLRADCTNNRLYLRVADTGPGIPAALRDRLFVPFERLGAEHTDTPGTGLGLANARQWAEALGGSIRYDDNPGGGSIFCIDLPIAGAEPQSAPGTARIGPMRILVVDDSQQARDKARHCLCAAGHAVAEAADGETGVRLAATGAYDVIVLDMIMPGFDGWETARRIRALPGPGGRVPIIAATAGMPDGHLQVTVGIDEHLTKPYAQPDLLAAIARVVQRQRGVAPWPDAFLARLAESLGAATVEAHLHGLADDIACLLEKLHGGEETAATRSLAHKLIGDAGGLGFAALAEAARTFDTATAEHTAAAAEALSQAAMQVEAALYQNLSAARSASIVSEKLS